MCHAERSTEESEASLQAKSKHPYLISVHTNGWLPPSSEKPKVSALARECSRASQSCRSRSPKWKTGSRRTTVHSDVRSFPRSRRHSFVAGFSPAGEAVFSSDFLISVPAEGFSSSFVASFTTYCTISEMRRLAGSRESSGLRKC